MKRMIALPKHAINDQQLLFIFHMANEQTMTPKIPSNNNKAEFCYWYPYRCYLLFCFTILLPNELSSFQLSYQLRSSHNVNLSLDTYSYRRMTLFSKLLSSRSSVDGDVVDISAMKIQEIKAELQRRKVAINDVFEKDELIRRLQHARQHDKSQPERKATVNAGAEAVTANTNRHEKVLSTPLYFTTMDQGMRVPAHNVNGGIIVEPSSQPYATMKIQIPSQQSNSNSAGDESPHRTLSLLVDTACTGLVVRPTVVQQCQLPSYDTPVTMQGAAGVSQATGLTQLSSFTLFPTLNPQSPPPPTRTFRSLPAAVQDIHGLPTVLDGIIGLSFINQFAAMEFDFRDGMIHFHQDRTSISDDHSSQTVVDTKLNMIGSLGIYTVPVFIGGRGPVQMLVDTGASCTLLNWKGVADLGLSQSSKQISRIAIPTGAMGSENVAIQLSHRLHVSSTFQLGDTTLSGVPISPETRMPIDIGQIPVIDNIPGVGGILGIDALMRCRTLRISTRHAATLTMLV